MDDRESWPLCQASTAVLFTADMGHHDIQCEHGGCTQLHKQLFFILMNQISSHPTFADKLLSDNIWNYTFLEIDSISLSVIVVLDSVPPSLLFTETTSNSSISSDFNTDWLCSSPALPTCRDGWDAEWYQKRQTISHFIWTTQVGNLESCVA